MSDQQPEDERIMLEEVPLVIETTYYNEGDPGTMLDIYPAAEPFILFRMKQKDGAVVLDVTASLIEGEDELIETLEAFFETMLEDRAARGLIPLSAEDIEDLVDERDDHNESYSVREV